jgi:hypothetical protein
VSQICRHIVKSIAANILNSEGEANALPVVEIRCISARLYSIGALEVISQIKVISWITGRLDLAEMFLTCVSNYSAVVVDGVDADKREKVKIVFNKLKSIFAD